MQTWKETGPLWLGGASLRVSAQWHSYPCACLQATTAVPVCPWLTGWRLWPCLGVLAGTSPPTLPSELPLAFLLYELSCTEEVKLPSCPVCLGRHGRCLSGLPRLAFSGFWCTPLSFSVSMEVRVLVWAKPPLPPRIPRGIPTAMLLGHAPRLSVSRILPCNVPVWFPGPLWIAQFKLGSPTQHASTSVSCPCVCLSLVYPVRPQLTGIWPRQESPSFPS